jgi:tetratricopeptide (TPR) repeat protein
VSNGLHPEIHKRFMEHVLGDLAERRNERGEKLLRGQRREEVVSGERRRVYLRGDHVCYLGPSEHFRGSDSTIRLDWAIRAGKLYYQATHVGTTGGEWNGALLTAELLLRSESRVCERFRARFLQGRRGPKPKSELKPKRRKSRSVAPIPTKVTGWRSPRLAELDAAIAEEERRRAGPKHPPEIERLARTILNQVDTFRRRQTKLDLDQIFEARFAAFRFDFCRDAEWYAEQEAVYKARIDTAEEFLDPAEGRSDQQPPQQVPARVWEQMVANKMCTQKTDVATAMVNLARLYHEQGKYSEAEPYYRRAIAIYNAASSVPEPWQKVILPWIDAQMANCRDGRGPDQSPRLEVKVADAHD